MKKALIVGAILFWVSAGAPRVIADIFDELEDETTPAQGDTSQQKIRVLQNQADSAFDSLDFETQHGTSSQSQEELDAEFNAWKQNYFAELKRYKQEILNIWDEAEVTDKTLWVEYSPDLKTKKVVDYEKNEIRVSFVGDSANSGNKNLKKIVEDIVATTPNQARRSDPVLKAINAEGEIQDKVNNEPLLSEIIESTESNSMQNDLNARVESEDLGLGFGPAISSDSSGTELVHGAKVNSFSGSNLATSETAKLAENSNNAKSVKVRESDTKAAVTALVETARIEKASQQKNLNLEPVTTVTIKLPSKSVLKRAKKYADYVQAYAGKNNLDEALVYAVMHTESAFNPMARSNIPAFGLMQIVPGSAGKDVAQQLYGETRVFSPSYLYNAKNNVEAGSTYLNILYYRYLRKIENPISRMYCAIAAYNTGAGNVSVAFTGNRKLGRAIPIINSKTPQEVYETLSEKLPYDETKMYLERVVNRHKMYREQML